MTRRLVQFDNPEARETPLLLLADLRAFDDLIELVYVGDQLWWVGRVTPSDELRDGGYRIEREMNALVNDEPRMMDRPSIRRNFMLARLLQQGFSRILQVRAPGDVSGAVLVEWITDGGRVAEYETTLVAEIRERYFHFNKDGGTEFIAERLMLTDPKHRKAMSDAAYYNFLKNEGLALYRREFRNRVQFGPGGTTGVRGDEISSGLILPASAF